VLPDHRNRRASLGGINRPAEGAFQVALLLEVVEIVTDCHPETASISARSSTLISPFLRTISAMSKRLFSRLVDGFATVYALLFSPGITFIFKFPYRNVKPRLSILP
jgi:hypothetical protein